VAPDDKIELHVIRTDVLLHRLTGFAERLPEYRAGKKTMLTSWQIRAIKLAAQTPRFRKGEAKRQAERLHLTTESFRVLVCRTRKGWMPRYWLYVPQDS